jgi:hypothetical protein
MTMAKKFKKLIEGLPKDRREHIEREAHRELETLLTDELQGFARHIHERLPEGWGFSLLIFPFDQQSMLYVSDGRREDMIKVIREYADKLEAEL